MTVPAARSRNVRRLAWALLVLALLLAGYQLAQAARAAHGGRQALEQARKDLRERDVDGFEAQLQQASLLFRSADGHLGRLGPVGWLAKVTPFVRVQLRATHGLVDSGRLVSDGALRVTPLARELLKPQSGRTVESLTARAAAMSRQVEAAADDVIAASRKIEALDDERLVWPLGGARREAKDQLVDAAGQVSRARHGLRVGLEVAGARGPKRFLVLSQNPDEVRPTGGYIGTYGVLTSNRGRLELERYGAMGSWTDAHPAADIPPAQAPQQFGAARPPQPQTLANVNTAPDWPASARLAAELWGRGGEPPVDGVLTFTPALLRRLIEAVGQVRVPGYPGVVTHKNLDERLEFYTHREAIQSEDASVRKRFISDLAPAVLDKALSAPPGQLSKVGTSLLAALDAREAALWLRQPDLQGDLVKIGWDGGFRSRPGDFFADAEFAFISKNGRGLKRTFTHKVRLQPDGSGTADTVMLVRNTLPFEGNGYNDNPVYYLTPYGPRGGVLAKESDPPSVDQPPLAGHPSAAWFRNIPALKSTTLHVRWDAPALAFPRSDGSWEYRLTWLPTPGHVGDVLELDVQLPRGWRWQGSPPPSRVTLRDIHEDRWVFTRRND